MNNLRSALVLWLVLCCGFTSTGTAAEGNRTVVPDDGPLETALERIQEHGEIFVRSGMHTVHSAIQGRLSGVTLRGEPGATVRMAKDFADTDLLQIEASGWTVSDLVLDGGFASAGAVRSANSTAKLRILRCEVRNWGRDGFDLNGTDELVEECQIHHVLRVTDGKPDTGHGIVTKDSKRLTIRRCQIWNCSGDAIQTDRGEWSELTIDDCELFTEPLAAGWKAFEAGQTVGQNAFSTKKAPKVPAGEITISRCRVWGFRCDVKTGNWAAFSLKENVRGTITDCDVRDSNIAFRMSLQRLGSRLNCLISNCQISECKIGLRIEDQKNDDADQREGSQINECRFVNCPVGIEFHGPSLAKYGIQTGDSIADCLFTPQFTVLIGQGDKKRLSEVFRHLGQQGNRGEDPPGALLYEARAPEASAAANKVAAAPGDSTTKPAVVYESRPQAQAVSPARPSTSKTSKAPTDRPGTKRIDDQERVVCPLGSDHYAFIYRRSSQGVHCRCRTCKSVWIEGDANSSDPKAPNPKTKTEDRPPGK